MPQGKGSAGRGMRITAKDLHRTAVQRLARQEPLPCRGALGIEGSAPPRTRP